MESYEHRAVYQELEDVFLQLEEGEKPGPGLLKLVIKGAIEELEDAADVASVMEVLGVLRPEYEHLRFRFLEQLTTRVKATEFVGQAGVIEELRETKRKWLVDSGERDREKYQELEAEAAELGNEQAPETETGLVSGVIVRQIGFGLKSLAAEPGYPYKAMPGFRKAAERVASGKDVQTVLAALPVLNVRTLELRCKTLGKLKATLEATEAGWAHASKGEVLHLLAKVYEYRWETKMAQIGGEVRELG